MTRRVPRLRPLDRALLCTAGGVSALVLGIVSFAPGAGWAAAGVGAAGLAGLAALGGIAWGEVRARRLRTRHAAELVRLRAALAHRERLSALGLATAGIVHDLRGPLAALQLGVELLQTPGLPDETRARVDRNLGVSVLRMRAQVDGLLAHARPDGGVPADPAEAAALAHRLVDLGGRHRICVDLPAAPGRVRLAAGGLTQVLLNLLDNALQAGTRVALEGTWGRTAAVLRVHDDGPGVAPGDRDRIFEPFHSGRATRGGTGLGLHCARALVEQAGGHLTVEDSLLGGACFVVWLPWELEAPQAMAS